MAFLPHSELVAVAWLRSIPSMLASAGTTLPKEATTWADGFLRVSIAGGRSDRDVPQHSPLLQVDVFFPNRGSGRPPWNKANQLSEQIRAACYPRGDDANPTQRTVTLPTGYQQARVQSAEVVTEPRRMLGDDARYALYALDLSLTWVAVPS